MVNLKKKVCDMNVDEFMKHGFDSDIDEEQTTSVVSKVNSKKNKSKKEKSKDLSKKKLKAASHKTQLGKLKDKDPEFFKFLQENDAGLLEFSGSEGESDSELKSSDALSDESGEESTGNVSDDEDESFEDESENVKPVKIVTYDVIKDWKNQLEKDSLKTLKIVFAAFNSAVHDMTPDEGTGIENDDDDKKKRKSKKSQKFKVDAGSIFNSLVAMCFKHSVRILEKHLAYNNNNKTKNKKKKILPSSSNKWSTVKTCVKQYLFNILQILRQLVEPTVLSAVLHHSQSLIPYFATFPKLCKMFLKRLVRMWSTGHENVRVLSFIALRRTILLKPNLFEYLVKKMYIAFVRNSKFVTLKSKVILQFMENSVIEMYAMNHQMAYQHGFVYIRQLAINLRNAITIKKKDSYQVVYNWQYVSCLQLWCRLIGEHHSELLQPLVYPLVEITLGVIRLSNSVRYYPLRFACIKLLNFISEKTGVYIPTATNILEAIEAKEFIKKPTTTEKPPDFSVVLKLTKSQVQSKGCQDLVIDLAFETMLRHYVIYSNSIAFPELVFPICHRLKRLTKESKVGKLCKDMKALVAKLQEHGDIITKERSLVSFSPRNIDEARKWETDRTEKRNILKDFESTWVAMKTRVEENEVRNAEDSSPMPKNRKRKLVTKGNEKNNEGDMKTKQKKKENEKKYDTKAKKQKHNSLEEDIIEDFNFSESDNE